jgi:glycosyltransferase involved in cell wall biosynthesis
MPDWVREPGGVDVVVAQRTCLPGPSQVWQDLARAGHAKLVFEIDDDLWHVDPSNRAAYELYVKGVLRDGHGRIVDPACPIGHNMAENIRVADLVTVTTEPLADLISQWNPNVAILPNMVPASLLDTPVPVQGEQVTIGYGASPSHIRDFGEIARPLRRVLQRFADIAEFHCMGADFVDRCRSHRGRTRFSSWFETVSDYLGAVDFSVGIAPLRQTIFNDSKSEIKLLELAALGVPSLVSDTGPYRRAYRDGVPCRVFGDGREFESTLIELLHSPADRAQLGKEAREWAATRTIEQHAWRWAEAYGA